MIYSNQSLSLPHVHSPYPRTRACCHPKKGKILKHAHINFWGSLPGEDSSASGRSGDSRRNTWNSYRPPSNNAGSFPFHFSVPFLLAPVHLVMPWIFLFLFFGFYQTVCYVLELCNTDVPYSIITLVGVFLPTPHSFSIHPFCLLRKEVGPKRRKKKERDMKREAHMVPMCWLHTYFPRWGWQMMSWTNVSLNKWAPLPSGQKPWQNPLGMAGGPRHTAVPCHCQYRSSLSYRWNFKSVDTKKQRQLWKFPPLSPLLVFPWYKWATFLWLIRMWAFKTKPFSVFRRVIPVYLTN